MVRHYFIGITVLLTTVFATLFAEKIQCKTSYWSVLGFGSFVDNLIYQKLFL